MHAAQMALVDQQEHMSRIAYLEHRECMRMHRTRAGVTMRGACLNTEHACARMRTRAGVSSEAPVSGSGRPRPFMTPTMGVSTGCGHRQARRTPRPARPSAMLRVKCTRPACMIEAMGQASMLCMQVQNWQCLCAPARSHQQQPLEDQTISFMQVCRRVSEGMHGNISWCGQPHLGGSIDRGNGHGEQAACRGHEQDGACGSNELRHWPCPGLAQVVEWWLVATMFMSYNKTSEQAACMHDAVQPAGLLAPLVRCRIMACAARRVPTSAARRLMSSVACQLLPSESTKSPAPT